MNLHFAEHLDKRQGIMVHDFAVTQIFCGNLCHLLIGEGEIPDVDILLHMLHMN